MSAGVLFDAPGPKARRRHMMLTVVGALLLLGGLFVVYQRMDEKGQFSSALWKPFTEWNDFVKPYIFDGLIGTLKAAGIAIVLAGILGFVFAMARMSQSAPVRWVASVLVEIFRSIPVLLVMLFTYGYLSNSSNVSVQDAAPLTATIAGLVFYNAAVVCEVIRSGVNQLPNGQREAGLSIGLTVSQTLRQIQLPQAITTMMPALISQLVVIVKDTALGYNVLYGEMLYSAKTGSTGPANIVPMLIVVAVIYIVLNYAISKAAEYVDRRLKRRGQNSKQQVPGGPVVEADAA
ncbi:amino acid ABC transporter permease [Yimella sp. cx-51]|uniref:amino acid ABC transporter permease n=1 Tax=Yimella sp. cx-51 TaxID=2770551 RepID=UPI00165D69DA|nr:amino acid ABC transporter permease [Yimella sp. cx-51]MBC9956485.1 amino acid ABC transporter permease [Yimella sp. cx-51]QTH38404.1 amino acid ABC transporter permease [Yimella sp. cx-51]